MTKGAAPGGFTLVEMMVSVGLFAIVMTIGMAALLSMITENRRAQSVNSVTTNLNFALESMARNLRTGISYSCAGLGNCAGGGSYITFTDQSGVAVRYDYDAGGKRLTRTKAGVTEALTSPDVEILDFAFYVRNVGSGDNAQPTILFKLYGKIPEKNGVTSDLSLQTLITQRRLEI